MMADREVGELWAYYKADDRESKDVRGLIRKLVEERRHTMCIHGSHCNHDDHLHFALRNFGIDPESWRHYGAIL